VSGKKLEIILLSLLLSIAGRQVYAESAASAVRKANKLYKQGQFKQAADGYDRAMTESPQAIEPQFNKADSYYRLDDLQQAIDLYKAVAAQSRDMQLVEKAKYNLGNCFFKQGTKLKNSDLQKALENMQTAIGSWRQVLDINPANEKAAKNIEVARLTIKDIIDQINKQKQEQQKQQQQQKQTQEDLKQLLEQQKSLADKTQQTKQKADSNSISQEQAQQDYKDIAKQQSDLKDKTEQAMEKMQQQQDLNNPDPKQQQAEQNLKNATDKQKDAAEKLNNSDAAGGKQSQDKAAEDIEKALKSLSEQQNQQQQQQKEQQSSQQQNQQEPNQPQEPNQAQQQQQEQQAAPDATAEEILDREQKQKEQRQMMQSPGFQNVDKDW
jgi:Ca-activated chloride channel family protein